MAAAQNYNQLKSWIFEIVDLQNGYPRTFLKIENSKLKISCKQPPVKKLLKNFAKFGLYVEKNDFEGGPR